MFIFQIKVEHTDEENEGETPTTINVSPSTSKENRKFENSITVSNKYNKGKQKIIFYYSNNYC